MDEHIIQDCITKALNTTHAEPWGAFGAIAADKTVYVEFRNEETGQFYIIGIQKGYV